MSSILFIDKSFVKPPPEYLRGVEIFNLSWIKDLVDAGHDVTVALESSWEEIFKNKLNGHMPKTVYVKHTVSGTINTIKIALKLFPKKFDYLILGNVGKGIIPGIKLLSFLRTFKRSVVLANREASKGFVRLCAKLNTTVLTVNSKIAEPFITAGCKKVEVDYGIVESDNFYPRNGDKHSEEKINFCLMGMLDNAWKGADTAIEAFKELPNEIKEKLHLHLPSYSNPPTFPEKDHITAYKWFPAEDAPDFLRKMDILLVLSRDEHIMRETFSQVIVQGMLTALPVIASDLPIFKEKLDEGGGVIVKNKSELQSAMIKIAEDKNLRLNTGKKAREIALSRYVWDTERFIEKYL